MTRVPTPDDVAAFETLSDPRLSPDGERIAYVHSAADTEQDSNRSSIWAVAANGGEPVALTRGDTDSQPRWSPDGRWLAFLRADGGPPQVWLLPVDGGEPHRLTDTSLGVTGFGWSPDSDRLVCTIVVDDADDDAAAPMVITRSLFKSDGAGWRRDRTIHLAVVDLDGQLNQLTHGDLTVQTPAWSPDGSELAFCASLHDDADLDAVTDVVVVPADGGPLRPVTKWDGGASFPRYTPDGETIVFAGGRPAAATRHVRLWRVPAAGGEPTPLLESFDRNVMVGSPGYPGAPPRITSDGESVVFCARDRGCTHVFSVPIDGGMPTTLLSSPERTVSGLAGPADDGTFAALIATPDTTADVYVFTDDEPDGRRLTAANAQLIAELELVPPEPRTFTAPDGLELQGWVLGADTDDGPRPLLLDIHGGPHNAWGPAMDTVHLYQQVLVARGWTVLMLNSRGSDGYGEAFFQAVYGGWGRNDGDDFLTAVDSLVERGVADPDRLAVTGYSYGGYMTNWLVTQTPRFRAAVTGGSVCDLASFTGSADVGPLLGSAEFGADLHEDPELYRDLSPLSYVGAVETPTLVLHGENDHRSPVTQAEQWFNSLRLRGETVEMVLYPDAGHLFLLSGRPSHRIDYNRRVVDWLTTHAGHP